MLQVQQRSRSTSVHSGQKAATSAEQRRADNTSESAEIEVTYKQGWWKYQAVTTLLFQTEDNQWHDIEFKHLVLLNVDVPQITRNGQFNRRDAEVEVQELLTELWCHRTTTIKKRVTASSGLYSPYSQSGSRSDDQQVRNLVHKGLDALVQHFRDDFRDYEMIADAGYGQERKDEIRRSDDTGKETAR